jgi:hypothetical protein
MLIYLLRTYRGVAARSRAKTQSARITAVAVLSVVLNTMYILLAYAHLFCSYQQLLRVLLVGVVLLDHVHYTVVPKTTFLNSHLWKKKKSDNRLL